MWACISYFMLRSDRITSNPQWWDPSSCKQQVLNENIPFSSSHITCSGLEQPLWGSTGLREHYPTRRLRLTGETGQTLQSANKSHLRHYGLWIHKMASSDLFLTLTVYEANVAICIPCHSKGCDPWQTPCGVGVVTRGSSPLLHWSLPYCPCPCACPAPSRLLPSWSHQESLSARANTKKRE